MEQQIKPGDFVRLTDPISNGEIVRIDNVDEYGYASWLGGSQAEDMEQVSIVDGASPIGNDIDGYYFTLSEIITEIERRVNAQTWLNLKKPFKLYPESAVQYWQHRAEKAEAENAINEKLLYKEHNKLLCAQDYIKKICKESSDDIQKLDEENKKLKEELARCRAKNAAYLREKKQAENKAELLEKEVADLKVPESRQNRHLRDELHKVRLERQQAWEKATEKLVNKATVESELQRVIAERNKYCNFAIELCDKFEALKQQLDGMKIVKEKR